MAKEKDQENDNRVGSTKNLSGETNGAARPAKGKGIDSSGAARIRESLKNLMALHKVQDALLGQIDREVR